MANYFWVGGSGTWNNSTTTNWSLSSGGGGGAGFPTSSDTATFDSLSNAILYTVTIAAGAACSDVTFGAPLSGNITIAGSAAFTVSGSLTFGPSNITRTYTGAVTFNSTSSGKTITCAGNALTTGGVTFNGVGGVWTFSDNFSNVAGAITLTNGTLDTNGKTVTSGSISSSNSNIRVLTLGASIVNLSTTTPVVFTTTTNLTFNANTSQINFTSNSGITFNASSLTYNNVSYTGSGSNNSFPISGAATFNNLVLPTPASFGHNITISNNITVNGTLTSSGGGYTNRLTFFSSVVGTTITITAASYSPSYCDFRDITISGGAAPVSGTSLGNCGGNSGINTDSPKTVYWNLAGSQVWSATGWAATSGGVPAASNFPLAQDTATFNDAGSITDITIASSHQIGTFDCSTRTVALPVAGTGNPSFYGNLTFSTAVTMSGTQSWTFIGRSTQNITSAGVIFTRSLTFSSVGSTITLQDAINSSNTTGISVTTGTFDANNKAVTTPAFVSTGTATRVINMGSGLWTLSGTGTVWSTTSTGITLNKGSANILLSDTTTSARTFTGSGLTYNKLTIGGTTGISTLTISGSNTFTELSSTKTVAHTISFTGGTTQTIGTWSVNGTLGNVVTLQSTNTTNFILTKSGGSTVTADYMSISRSTGNPDLTWLATNSTDGSNNIRWYFGSFPPPVVSTGSFMMLF